MKTILLPFLLMSASFGQLADNRQPFPTAVTPGMQTGPTSKAQPSNKVVASIDGKQWTAGQIQALVAALPSQIQDAYYQRPAETVNHVLMMQYLAEHGGRHRLYRDRQVRQNLDWIRQDILAQAETRHAREGYRPSADEVRKVYDSDPRRWEQARVRVIYVSILGAVSGAAPGVQSEQQARTRIEEVRVRILNGADFGTLAKECSDDKVSAAKGGEWNPIDRGGSFPEAARAAIFALRPGEVSQPVRLPSGFYLFKLESVDSLRFEKVEPRIRASLIQSRFSEWFRGVKLRFAAKIEDPAYFEGHVLTTNVVDGDDDDDDSPGIPQSAATAPGENIPPDRVVAKVDAKAWTAGQLKAYIATLPGEIQASYIRNAADTLGYVLLSRYLARQAELHHLDRDPRTQQYLRWARVNLLSQAELSRFRTTYRPSLQQQKQFYDQNLDRWKQVQARAIYLAFSPGIPKDVAMTSAPGVTTRTEEEAKTKIEAIRMQLANGADFAKLARENSDDPLTAPNGGLWNPINRTGPYPEAAKASIFALKPGEVGEPVQQPRGFYLFMVESIGSKPFVEVQSEILRELQQAHFNVWFKSVKSRFSANVFLADFFNHDRAPGSDQNSRLPRMQASNRP